MSTDRRSLIARGSCTGTRAISPLSWILGLLGLLGLASTASAVPLVDLVIDTALPPSGLIVYDGAGGPLTGFGIEVHSVAATDTPANAGTYGCVGCTIGFQTADLLSVGTTTWVFGTESPGSFISISGGLDVDGDGISDLPFSFLGDFTGAQVSVDLLSINSFDIGLVLGAFDGAFDSGFTSFFDVPSDTAGTLALEWGGLGQPPGAIVAGARDGGASIAFADEPPPPPPPPPPVAEPGSAFLLGLAILLGIARRLRRG